MELDENLNKVFLDLVRTTAGRLVDVGVPPQTNWAGPLFPWLLEVLAAACTMHHPEACLVVLETQEALDPHGPRDVMGMQHLAGAVKPKHFNVERLVVSSAYLFGGRLFAAVVPDDARDFPTWTYPARLFAMHGVDWRHLHLVFTSISTWPDKGLVQRVLEALAFPVGFLTSRALLSETHCPIPRWMEPLQALLASENVWTPKSACTLFYAVAHAQHICGHKSDVDLGKYWEMVLHCVGTYQKMPTKSHMYIWLSTAMLWVIGAWSSACGTLLDSMAGRSVHRLFSIPGAYPCVTASSSALTAAAIRPVMDVLTWSAAIRSTSCASADRSLYGWQWCVLRAFVDLCVQEVGILTGPLVSLLPHVLGKLLNRGNVFDYAFFAPSESTSSQSLKDMVIGSCEHLLALVPASLPVIVTYWKKQHRNWEPWYTKPLLIGPPLPLVWCLHVPGKFSPGAALGPMIAALPVTDRTPFIYGNIGDLAVQNAVWTCPALEAAVVQTCCQDIVQLKTVGKAIKALQTALPCLAYTAFTTPVCGRAMCPLLTEFAVSWGQEIAAKGARWHRQFPGDVRDVEDLALLVTLLQDMEQPTVRWSPIRSSWVYAVVTAPPSSPWA